MKLLLVGATGLVGSHVLQQAIGDERIDAVVAPTRRALSEAPGLLAPQVDFDDLPEDAPWWRVDAVICALGTTMKKAGAREAFRRVDHHYPLEVARLARQQGVPTFVLNSAMGADPHAHFFYNRVKGKLEHDLGRLGFISLTHVRPGLIGGKRDEFRLGERLAMIMLEATGPMLPRRWRIHPATNIARAMLDAAVAAAPGVHVVGPEALA